MPQVRDASAPAPQPPNEGLLLDLVTLTARRDRVAFTALYEHVAPTVQQVAVRLIPDDRHALAVVQAVFLEIWHLASLAPDRRGVWPWIMDIAERRIGERARAMAAGQRTLAYNDQHTARELWRLLGDEE